MKVSLKNLKKSFSPDKISVIKDFIKFIQTKLTLKEDVIFSFLEKRIEPMTTGVRLPNHEIHVLSGHRLLIDVLRTVAHEWVHEYQHQKMGLKDDQPIKDIGGPEENMASVLASVYLKSFEKDFIKYEELLYEEASRTQRLIFELAPHSTGVQELIIQVENMPELLKHMNFKSIGDLEQYIEEASYEDFTELRDEVNKFIQRRKKYFQSEMDEFERVSQDLSRDEGIDISVNQIINAFEKAKEIKIPSNVWSKLENTESNQIKKGETAKVIALAKQYNKQHPKELKKALLSGDYRRPLILKFGDRYHLVAGNTRLCTAAALGMKPQVIIAEI